MLPLPAAPFEAAVWSAAKVLNDYLVSDGRNKYSVPYNLIGEKVDIRVTKTIVEVYFHGSRVASHRRLQTKQREPLMKLEHMLQEHQRYLTYNEDDFKTWAMSVGPMTEKAVYHFIDSGKAPEQGYKAGASLKKLGDRYGWKRLENGGCGRKVGQSRGRKEEIGILFTYEKKVRALQLYEQTHSVTETIRILGYPERATLYRWISEKGQPEKVRSTKRGENTPDHPRHPSVEVKLQVLHRCFEHGEDVKSVSEEIGYSRASIYNWRRKYLQRGLVALMNPSDDPREELVPGTFSATEDIAELKAQVQEMQMQIDILKETINVLKKDPGIDQTALRNQEKAAIIDALKNKYSLPELLSALHCPRSSYYYQQKRAKKQDKYCHVKEKIKDIFESNHRCYGYRRIYATLKKEGLRLSEKVIRRLMKQVGVQGVNRKKTSYSSYQGEITPAVPNLLKRDFHANRPNEKWLTDITEFAIPAGKVYLSPIIDCFDGMPVCWSIGISPNAELTNGMLDKAISLLKVGEHPVVHTDRGCHYRWPGWISRMEAAHLHRSMSKKGCSPDNSACEGFFGRMKNEMFYGISWLNVSIEEFIHTVEDYMVWYREKRIKISLGGLSPLEYRQKLGLSA